ncbi:MAG: hypothetical protein VW879_19005, partial [Opitutae bacterium]
MISFRKLERTSEPMEWIVDLAGGQDFASLEQALAHEIVLSGDTIRIAPGEYVHSEDSELVVSKGVVILGDGDGEVILKRGGSPRTEYQSNPSSNWYFPER